MKKLFLSIVVLCLFLSGNVNAATATCLSGKCDFYMSVDYESAETTCYQTLYNEEVETSVAEFTILDTGEKCSVLMSN